ncbi:MAG: homoserine dehydrogenase [bacterium]|nr:homoserine dehydrogenase [bacterium]
MDPVKVGIIGLGTIGCGTIRILQENGDILAERLGASIEVVRIADLDLDRPRDIKLDPAVLTTDARSVIDDPDVQIVVELIGGIEPARTFILDSLDKGKHVITANKALLSEHWQELVERAEEKGVSLLYEGSVAGGIPLVRTIKAGLVANRIRSVTGIINGTCNYILSRMSAEKCPYGEILAEAMEMGYAEADPAMDVDGIDAAQKLSILVNLCFNTPVSWKDLPCQGITGVTPLDLEMAEEFGYRVKLLASAKMKGGSLEAWVHPALVPEGHPLAPVDNVFNAVYIEDDNMGPSLYYGRGAGALPTGSAVVADIVSCARDLLSGAVGRVPVGGSRLGVRGEKPCRLAADTVSEYYVRISAKDQPGVLSAISGILGEEGISISSVIQRGRQMEEGGDVPLVMIVHGAPYSRMTRALARIDGLDVTLAKSFLMRILPEGEWI